MRASVILGTAALFMAASAPASVITLGSSNAVSCYRAAEAQILEAASWQACDAALQQEALLPRDHAGTLVNRGILFLLSGQVDAAIRDFDEAAKVNPSEPEVYLNRAIAAWKAGDSAMSLRQAEQALALNTRKPALAFYVRGISREEQGQVRAAYADLKRASELAPNWAEPQRELARYQVRQR